ncbi:MAG TPA: metalloregulator ArsR/SmtB family transcription factor [Bacteroidota bacterium]|nr:metalloregulator ArsR/SmtB family transcription factor [Bacteroidota bacterium]
MESVVSSTKVLSEEIRLRIVLLLADQEACVCELMAVFDMAQSKLSHHLIALREAGFLKDSKRGKWNYYKVPVSSLNTVNRELFNSYSRLLADDETAANDKALLRKVQREMQICC